MAVLEAVGTAPTPGLHENPFDASMYVAGSGGNTQLYGNEHVVINVYLSAPPAIAVPQATPNATVHNLENTQAVNLHFHYENNSGANTADERQNVRIAQFLRAVYALDLQGQDRHAIRRVIDYLDDLQNAGRFDECDAVFRQADPGQMSPSVLASFLGITRAAKNRLRSRRRFYDDAVAVVENTFGKAVAIDLLKRFN
jgi:hypothetical protein